jgi:hypothetical protein
MLVSDELKFFCNTTITKALPITLSLPASQSTGKLRVQFVDESNQCHAHSFVNVE